MNGGYPCRAEFLGDSGNGFSGDLPPKRLGSQGQQGAGRRRGQAHGREHGGGQEDAVENRRQAALQLGRDARLLIRWALNPAPKPLSMLTTETPLAQEFIMASRVVTPRKLAP